MRSRRFVLAPLGGARAGVRSAPFAALDDVGHEAAQGRQACLAGKPPRILAALYEIPVDRRRRSHRGVGKTSFVELAPSRSSNPNKVLERVENPFLRDFCLDKTGAAFQAQLFFLLSRYRQLMELSQRTLFLRRSRSAITFSLKDKIFAYLNLDDSELLIYDKLYAMLEPQTPKPDLVIFLQADTPRL